MAQLEMSKVEVYLEGHCLQDTIEGVSALGADRVAAVFPWEEVGRRGLTSIATYYNQVYNIELNYPSLNCVLLGCGVWVPIELVRIISLPNMKGANLYQASPSPPHLAINKHRATPTSPTTFPTVTITTGHDSSCSSSLSTTTTTTVIDSGSNILGSFKPTTTTNNITTATTAAAPATTTSSYKTTTEIQEAIFEVKIIKVNEVTSKAQQEVDECTGKIKTCTFDGPKTNTPDTPFSLHTWAMFNYHKGLTTRDISTFLILLKETGRKERVEVAGPVQLRFPSSQNPLEEVQVMAKTYPGLQLIVAVLDDRVMYGRMKVVGDLCLGVVTLIIHPTIILKPTLTTLKRLIQQINTKIGGTHLRLPLIVTPHLAPSLLVMALHHSSPTANAGPAVVAVVASANLSAGQYLTEVYTQMAKHTSIVNLADVTRRVLEAITQQYGRSVPEQILLYSDGMEQRHMLKVMREELTALTTACDQFMKNYKPSVTYVAVQGSPLRWFTEEDVECPVTARSVEGLHSFQTSNTTFSICVSSDNKSWQPAQYSILSDSHSHNTNSTIPVEEVHRFTKALCHFPACPASLQPLPCLLICAHLAAQRCRQHIKTLRNNWMQAEYKDLQRDINHLVRVDTAHPIAHQLYYL